MRRLLTFVASAALTLGWCGIAGAFVSTIDPGHDGGTAEIAVPSTMQEFPSDRQRQLSRSAAWRTFEVGHGRWSVWWNERTGTPHRAGGAGIALEGFANDSASVDAAVRGFIARHRELFRSPTLATMAVQHVGRLWYARYRQLIEGIPVLGADWEFRIGENGNLFLFGADAHDPASYSSRALGRGLEAARASALRDIRFDPARDRIEGGERRYLLPVPRGAGVELRAVYDLRVRTQSPRGHWMVRVDAISGEVLERRSLIRHAIDGTVTATVHPVLPSDPLTPLALPHLWVQVGAESSATNLAGLFSVTTNSGPISAQLDGRYVDVHRVDGMPDANYVASTHGGGTYNIAWTDANSDAAERDAYYHVTLAHDDVKRIDPGLLRLDRPVLTTVNEATSCNAYWDGYNIGFLVAGSGCVNTASVPSIVYHEYGHGVAYERYRQAANDTTVFPVNGLLGEGMAEINGMLLEDNPVMGKGLRGPGTHVRTNGLVNRWPDDVSLNDYSTMFILTGSFWDLRLDQGKALAEHLFHFAQYGVPDHDSLNVVAITEYFLETVAADDNDADLANGTPHLAAILRAFNARGIGTRLFFSFGHTPLADQPVLMGGPQVTTTINYSGAIGAFDPASLELWYSINGSGWWSVPMTPTGMPDQWRANIPATGAGVLRYYLQAKDTFGGISTQPVDAPNNRPYTFIYGNPSVRFADDMEIDRGWSASDPSDNATAASRWVRLDPNSTTFFDPIQTGDDHTAVGTMCWVTGNAGVNVHSNFADVDSGRTSLTSPTLDASGIGNPVIEYYRWYFNRGITEPDTDPWRVYLSNNNGTSWIPIESTTHTENRWERIVLRIQQYLPPTNQMKIRFVAMDSISNSTVEAAIDDFRLLGLPTPVDVPDVAGGPRALKLVVMSSNPSSEARFEYVLPRSGPMSLNVVDVGGRVVARLVSGLQEAGRGTAKWAGASRAAPGLYFGVLESGGEKRVRRITLLR